MKKFELNSLLDNFKSFEIFLTNYTNNDNFIYPILSIKKLLPLHSCFGIIFSFNLPNFNSLLFIQKELKIYS